MNGRAPAILDHLSALSDATRSRILLLLDRHELVDFWAEWCGPCKAIAPTIDVVAKAFEGRAKVTKLNVDQNISIASRYNIKGIPTLLLFKNGMVKEQIVGSTSKESITKMIEKHL